MDHLRYFELVSGTFASELEVADAAAHVARTRWTVGELGAHLGEVHRWAAECVRTGQRSARENVPDISVSVAAWYSNSRADLLSVLVASDPDATTYTISRTDRTTRFWYRRQLFETLIHLWDLRSATDPTAPPFDLPPEVHADGIDELLEVFTARTGEEDRDGFDATISLEATDLARSWVIGPRFEIGVALPPDAVIRGTAAELLLVAWNRWRVDLESYASLSVEGNPAVVAAFHRAHIRP